MEIHAPHHPTLTFKEALVHLCIVTAGILIALSLEGTLEWWHHRELVQETRERLEAEIRGNQESIQTVLKSLDPAKTRFIHAIDVASDLSAPGKREEAASIFSPGILNLSSGMSWAFFNTAAHTTAQVTGAFGLMEYGDAFKYADAYDLQALYARMQDGIERDVVSAVMLGSSIPGKPTPSEIDDTKRQLRLALGGIIILEEIAKRLNELYSTALKHEP